MTRDAILEINELTIGYRSPIVQGVNLQLHRQEFITIMGENGVGKTTLIETLLGSLKSLSGGFKFFGNLEMPIHMDQINAKTAWVLSRQEAYPRFLKVESFFNALKSVYPNWNSKLVEDLSGSFGLDLTKRLTELSLGENSKVRLVKALAMEPELLILDELTANLSDQSKMVMTRKLLDSFSDRPMAVLYVSHSREEANRLSDRVLILSDRGLREA